MRRGLLRVCLEMACASIGRSYIATRAMLLSPFPRKDSQELRVLTAVFLRAAEAGGR